MGLLKEAEMFKDKDYPILESPDTPSDVLHSYAEDFRNHVTTDRGTFNNDLTDSPIDAMDMTIPLQKLINNPNTSEDTLSHLYHTVAPASTNPYSPEEEGGLLVRSNDFQKDVIRNLLSHKKAPVSIAEDFINRSWSYPDSPEHQAKGTSLHRIASSHPQLSGEIIQQSIDKFLKNANSSVAGVPDYVTSAKMLHNLIDQNPLEDTDENPISSVINTLLPISRHEDEAEHEKTLNFYLDKISDSPSDKDLQSIVSRTLLNKTNKFTKDQLNKLYESTDSYQIRNSIHKNPNVDPSLIAKEALSSEVQDQPNKYALRASALSSPYLPEETRKNIIQTSTQGGLDGEKYDTLESLIDNPSLSSNEAHEIFGFGNSTLRERILKSNNSSPEMFEYFITHDFEKIADGEKKLFISDNNKIPSNCLKVAYELSRGERLNLVDIRRSIMSHPNVDHETLELGANDPSEQVRNTALFSDDLWNTVLPEKIMSGAISDLNFLDNFGGKHKEGSCIPPKLVGYFSEKYGKAQFDPSSGEGNVRGGFLVPYALLSKKFVPEEIKDSVVNGVIDQLKIMKDNYPDETTLATTLPADLTSCFNVISNPNYSSLSASSSSNFINQFTKIAPNISLSHISLKDSRIPLEAINNLIPHVLKGYNSPMASQKTAFFNLMGNINLPEDKFTELMGENPYNGFPNGNCNPLKSRLQLISEDQSRQLVSQLASNPNNNFMIASCPFVSKDQWRNSFSLLDEKNRTAAFVELGIKSYSHLLNDDSFEDAMLGKYSKSAYSGMVSGAISAFDISNPRHRDSMVRLLSSDNSVPFTDVVQDATSDNIVGTIYEVLGSYLPSINISKKDNNIDMINELNSSNPSASAWYASYYLHKATAAYKKNMGPMGVKEELKPVINKMNELGDDFWVQFSSSVKKYNSSSFEKPVLEAKLLDEAYDLPNVSEDTREMVRSSFADIGFYSKSTLARFFSDYPNQVLTGLKNLRDPDRVDRLQYFLASSIEDSASFHKICNFLSPEIITKGRITKDADGNDITIDENKAKEIADSCRKLGDMVINQTSFASTELANVISRLAPLSGKVSIGLEKMIAENLLAPYLEKKLSLIDLTSDLCNSHSYRFLPDEVVDSVINNVGYDPKSSYKLFQLQALSGRRDDIINSLVSSPKPKEAIKVLGSIDLSGIGSEEFSGVVDFIRNFLNEHKYEQTIYNHSDAASSYSSIIETGFCSSSKDKQKKCIEAAFDFFDNQIWDSPPLDVAVRQSNKIANILKSAFVSGNEIDIKDKVKLFSKAPSTIDPDVDVSMPFSLINEPDIILSGTHGWKLYSIVRNAENLNEQNTSIISNRVVNLIDSNEINKVSPVIPVSDFSYEMGKSVLIKKEDFLRLMDSVASYRDISPIDHHIDIFSRYCEEFLNRDEFVSGPIYSEDMAINHIVPNVSNYVLSKIKNNQDEGLGRIKLNPALVDRRVSSGLAGLINYTNSIGGTSYFNQNSIGMKTVTEIRPKLIEAVSSIYENALSFLRQEKGSLDSMDRFSIHHSVLSFSNYLGMENSDEKLRKYNNEELMSVLNVIKLHGEIADEYENHENIEVNHKDMIKISLNSIAKGWVKNSHAVRGDQWGRVFQEAPVIMLNLGSAPKISKEMLSSTFYHIKNYIKSSQYLMGNVAMLHALEDWPVKIDNEGATIVPDFLKLVMDNCTELKKHSKNRGGMVEASVESLAVECMKCAGDLFSFEDVNKINKWVGESNDLYKSSIGSYAVSSNAGGDTLVSYFTDSYIKEFSPILKAHDHSVPPVSRLISFMGNPYLSSNNFSKIIDMIKENGNEFQLSHMLNEFSKYIPHNQDSVNIAFDALDSLNPMEYSRDNIPISKGPWIHDAMEAMSNLAKKCTSLSWEKFNGFAQKYAEYKGRKDSFRYSNAKGILNPFFSNPRFGVRLFKSMPYDSSKIHLTKANKKLLPDFIQDTSSRGWKRISETLMSIPQEGITWVNFKRQFPKQSNWPEIKDIFMSKPNSPVFTEDLVNKLKENSSGFNITYTVWEGIQRHNSGGAPNLVMQFNASEDFMKNINQDSRLSDLFLKILKSGNNIEDSIDTLHPVTPFLIGWARIDSSGGKEGWVIEEFQSDFEKHLNKIIRNENYGNLFKLAGKSVSNEELDGLLRKIQKLTKNWKEIAFSGIESAAKKHDVEKLFLHGEDIRAELSGMSKDKKYPNWLTDTYGKFPKTVGMENYGSYFKYPNVNLDFARRVEKSTKTIEDLDGNKNKVPRNLNAWVKLLNKKEDK